MDSDPHKMAGGLRSSHEICTSTIKVYSCSAEATTDNLKDGRTQYEGIILHGISYFKEAILKPLLKQLKLEPVSPPRINLKLVDPILERTTEFILNEITTIGRKTDNSIELYNQDISRVNCVIFIAGHKIMVLDTWSMFGTHTTHSKSGKTYNSTPGNRNLIAYNIEEKFEITIGPYVLTINPDEEKIKSPHKKQTDEQCCVCLDKPRTIRLPCGHACMCADCAKQVMASTAKCPICRASANSIFHSACVESYTKT